MGKKAWSTQYVLSPDSRVMAMGGWELDLRDAWNGDQRATGVSTGETLPEAEPLCFSPDGAQLAVSCQASIRLYRFHGDGAFTATLPAAQVIAAAFSPGGMLLTTLSRVNGLELWDVKRQRRIRKVALDQ
jgi:WD40 repeat protein